MKVFVFGASGLVGSACVEAALRRRHQVHAFFGKNPPACPKEVRVRQLDLGHAEALERLVLDEWPDAIINAAAVSRPEAVDADPVTAQRINVDLPGQLALLSRHLGSRLIHFSTDLVFDGTRAPYRSTDLPNPLSAYGKTKLEAEKRVLRDNPFDPVVLRITLVNGNSPSGHRSVHETLLDSIAEGKRPTLFTDEVRQPCSAGNVAEAAIELSERRDISGIFHWAGATPVSRYELGQAILRRFGLPPALVTASTQAEAATETGPRPADLRFNLDPLSGKLRTQAAPLEAQLDELQPPPHLYRWIRSRGRV